MRKEIQTKGVIGDSIHFDALGDMQEFVKMLVGTPWPFKDGCHNSFIVRRSETGRSLFPSAAILKSFKIVGSARDLLWIVSSRLSRGLKKEGLERKKDSRDKMTPSEDLEPSQVAIKRRPLHTASGDFESQNF
nr:hypothetical protein [Tanacetum cinerariifolium]